MVGILDNILYGTGNQNSKGGLLGFLASPYAGGLAQGLLSGQGNFAQNVGLGMGIGNQYQQQELKNKLNTDALGLRKNLTEAQIQNLKYDQSYKDRMLGLENKKLGILQQKQAAAQQLQDQINNIILSGGTPQVAPSAPSLPYEDTQAQMTMMPQTQINTAQPVTPPANNANVMMQLGAISKNPSLVAYGKSLLDQQQNSPAFIAEKKQAEKFGSLRGEDKAAFEGLATKMPELLSTVGELRDLADKATYTWVGTGLDAIAKQGAGITTEGAAAEQKYISKVNNQILPLLRDTFGSQFTAQEGESLKATLGDPSMTPTEKQAVLDAFVEQKIKDVQVGARRFGYQVPDYNIQQSYPATKTINWSDL